MNTDRIVLELRSLNNMIRRYFESSSRRGEIESVTGNNGWIIGYLADHQGQDIYQRDIEDHFTITRSTTSKVLSLMEQKGLIQKQAVAQDARLKRIVLTPKAWAVREIMLEDGNQLEETLVRGFQAEEKSALLAYLRRMKENISDMQEKN